MEKTVTDKEQRKGIIIYKDYFQNEFEDLTDEQLGILLRALYEYDKDGFTTTKTEQIENDKCLKILFRVLTKNHDRAVAEWDRKRNYWKNKSKNKGTEGTETEDNGNTPGKAKNGTQTVQAVEKANIKEEWKSLYRKEKFGSGHSVRQLMFLEGETINAHFEIVNSKNVISQEEFLKLEKEMGDIELIKDMVARANKEGWKEHWENYL